MGLQTQRYETTALLNRIAILKPYSTPSSVILHYRYSRHSEKETQPLSMLDQILHAHPKNNMSLN